MLWYDWLVFENDVHGDARSLSQDGQEVLRVRGVKLFLEGYTQVEVATVLGVTVRAVQKWVRRYRCGGWEALEKQKRGRDSESQMVLSVVDQKRLSRLIAGKYPDQLRIPGLLWTRSGVRDLIERETGVRFDLSTVGRYLSRWGFTLKRPAKRALEADPVVVEAWLKDIYPALKARAKREHALILWADESGIQLQHLTPNAGYAPIGQQSIARRSAKRVRTNMISALAVGGQLHFSVFDKRFTSPVFIGFLTRLIRHYPDRKLILICDNHRVHHAKAVNTWINKHHEQIELVFLPPYSPQLNPDELLNQDLKRHLRQTHPHPTNKHTLKTMIRSFLHRRQNQPQTIKNYFTEKHVNYTL